ncbi:transglutaminase domain-containing protein [Paraflavisolibacter sp. H34]|uniref:transglutaminase domain-containing protein n=1 Tax=Huijunlia imazamoxiresistens TaxID=3127457 RepID=UPI003018FB40
MRKIALSLAALLLLSAVHAQKTPPAKFGKITPEDLQKTVYSIDSNASAVVIADVGRSVIEGNTKGWFSLEHTHYKRVHVLKKSSYMSPGSSVAEVEIQLYVRGTEEERLNSIKAVTYNLENGKVLETKLEKSGIITDKYDRNHIVKKFTFPNVKEGSVIEFEYTVTSDFLFNLQPWNFQGNFPRLWSEYNVTIPGFLDYITLKQGYYPFFISDHTASQKLFSITESNGTQASEHYSFTSGVGVHRWVMKDVPELKMESFTSTLANHRSRIEFQLSEFREPLTPKKFMATWPQLAKDLLADEDFGKSLSSANNWMADEVKEATAGAVTEADKARRIFAWVRESISCTDHNARYITQPLKNVLKARKGNVAEVNLLLTAMLRAAQVQADPVLLSTRDHGATYAMYPIITQYNYVVCQALVDGRLHFLDASTPRMGFGRLPADCYNSTARLIAEVPVAIELRPDSVMEKKLTAVVMINDEKGKWVGHLNQTLGYFESVKVREKIMEGGREGLVKMMQKVYGSDLTLSNSVLDSVNKYEEPLGIQYDFEMNNAGEDILYFNPMFAEGQKENPFKSAERLYPVEMPCTTDETFVLTMEVPKGYAVDELPKNVKVKLNEKGEGMFEYLVSQSGETISMRSRLKLSRATFQPDEYELLREFFTLVVNKHSEQIVFKKKK